MLYGDDDTQFFLDGALRLAKDFDPDLPWFITGNAALASPNCMPHRGNSTVIVLCKSIVNVSCTQMLD